MTVLSLKDIQTQLHQSGASPYTVLDLFAGAGGLSLGCVGAGYKVVGAVEYDERAANTYKHNISYFQGYEPLVLGGEQGDMNNIDPWELKAQLGQVDVMVGGPPCKAYSTIGRGKLNSLSDEGYALDPRNKLYERYRLFLEVFAPKAFIMENVTGMFSVNGQNLANIIALELSENYPVNHPGFEVRYAVLDASWYGVPQYRHRIIFVGIRKDLNLVPEMPPRLTTGAPSESGYMQWPEQPFGQLNLFGEQMRVDYSTHVPIGENPSATTTVKQALDDLPKLTQHLTDNKDTPKEWRTYEPCTDALGSFAQIMQQWDGPTSSRPQGASAHYIRMTRRDFETFRQMKQGDCYPDAVKIANQLFESYLEREKLKNPKFDPTDEELQTLKALFVPPYPTDGGFIDRWQKLVENRPSWTVTAHLSKDTYSHIHYDSSQARAVSVRDAARLQSFPDRFEFGPVGGLNAAYAQIGNAVPPLMGLAIASHLKTQLDNA